MLVVHKYSPAVKVCTHFKLGNWIPAFSSFEKFQDKVISTSISSGSPRWAAVGASSVEKWNVANLTVEKWNVAKLTVEKWNVAKLTVEKWNVA